jgi:hypothetical protein
MTMMMTSRLRSGGRRDSGADREPCASRVPAAEFSAAARGTRVGGRDGVRPDMLNGLILQKVAYFHSNRS